MNNLNTEIHAANVAMENALATMTHRGYGNIETFRIYSLEGCWEDPRTLKFYNISAYLAVDDTVTIHASSDRPCPIEYLTRSEHWARVEEYVGLWGNSPPNVVLTPSGRWASWACEVRVPLTMLATAKSCARVVEHVELFASGVFDGFDDVLAGYSPAVSFARARNRALSAPNPILELG